LRGVTPRWTPREPTTPCTTPDGDGNVAEMLTAEGIRQDLTAGVPAGEPVTP